MYAITYMGSRYLVISKNSDQKYMVFVPLLEPMLFNVSKVASDVPSKITNDEYFLLMRKLKRNGFFFNKKNGALIKKMA